MLVRQSNQISSKTQDNKMVVPRARRQLGGMGGLNYLLLLRCFKIVPILGLVVYTIALLVPSMVQPFNIRGVQEVLSVGANVPTENIEVPTATPTVIPTGTDATTTSVAHNSQTNYYCKGQ